MSDFENALHQGFTPQDMAQEMAELAQSQPQPVKARKRGWILVVKAPDSSNPIYLHEETKRMADLDAELFKLNNYDVINIFQPRECEIITRRQA